MCHMSLYKQGSRNPKSNPQMGIDLVFSREAQLISRGAHFGSHAKRWAGLGYTTANTYAQSAA